MQQQQQLSLHSRETQVLLQWQQGLRFLLLLLATPPVCHLSTFASVFHPGAAAADAAQLQQLRQGGVDWRRRHCALRDGVNDSSSSSSCSGGSDRNSCSGLAFEWGSIWAARRQQQRLVQRRQQLLRCFFLDLNDSSAAMAVSMEVCIRG